MWGSFIAAVCLLVALVFPPGFLMLRGLGVRAERALACAPLASLLVYSVLAIAYAKVGVACTWLSMALPCFAISAACFGVGKAVASRRRERPSSQHAGPSAGHETDSGEVDHDQADPKKTNHAETGVAGTDHGKADPEEVDPSHVAPDHAQVAVVHEAPSHEKANPEKASLREADPGDAGREEADPGDAGREEADPWSGLRQGARSLALYLAVGAVATATLFVAPLGSADSFVCGFDIAHHMSLARSFVESGNWSTLETTLFPGQRSVFYPSLNSLISATVISALGVPVPLAINAGNAFQLAFVFPVGMWMFMTRLFGARDIRTYLGAICSFLFLAFPWELFMRSAPLLYAYLVGMALIPAASVLVMDCFGELELPTRGKLGVFAGRVLIALAGLACVALGHPSAFFSAALFVVVYVAYALVAGKGSLSRRRRVLLVVVWIALCALAWVALVKAPFMQMAVVYEYDEKAAPLGGIKRVFGLLAVHMGLQYLLGLVVVLGAVACLLDRRARWLLAPYLVAAVFYYCSLVIPPGELRTLISGFWYNHALRLGAAYALFAMPMAAQGLAAIAGGVSRLLRKWHVVARVASSVAVACVVAAIAFLPLPLSKAVTLVDYADIMQKYNDPNYKTSFLDQEERGFLQKAAQITGDDLVINFPRDGSAFAYALTGMNTMARSFNPLKDEDKLLLAQHANEITANPAVAEAADNLGARYVLLLDIYGSGKRTLYGSDGNEWEGLFYMNDETEGYEPVLSEGNMRLYRITQQPSAQ